MITINNFKKIFFRQSLANTDQRTLEDFAILYTLAPAIIEHGTDNDAFRLCSLRYPYQINISQFKNLFSELTKELNSILLREAFERVEKIVNNAIALNISIEEVQQRYTDLITRQSFYSLDEALVYAYSIFINNNPEIDDTFIKGRMLYIILNFDELYPLIDNVLVNADEDYDNIPVRELIISTQIVYQLTECGVFSIKDLRTLSVESLSTFLVFDINFVKVGLETLLIGYKTNLKENVEEVFNRLDSRIRGIISCRNGFEDGNELTLEETGRLYNLTRERIRQLEAKGDKQLLDYSKEVNKQITCLFYGLTGVESKFVTFDQLCSYVNDFILSQKIIKLVKSGNVSIGYNDEFKLFYSKRSTSPKEYEDELTTILGDTIAEKDILLLDKTDQAIVEKKYRLHNHLYIRRGVTVSDLTAAIIDELFPNGYKIDDVDTYNLLCKELKIRYGDEYALASLRAVDSKLMCRPDFVQIGKGLYKRNIFCATIPDELFTRIVEYMAENGPTLYYHVIYEAFKDELISLGIDNYYYMKGLIDPKLPTSFKTKRNYVITDKYNVTTTGAESITQFFRSFNGIFSYDEISSKFKGIPDYMIWNTFYNEEQYGLLVLSGKRFVYYSSIVVPEWVIKALEKHIEALFLELKQDTISCRKLYARISLVDKKVLDSIKEVNDHFSLFSLVKYLFKDKYGFSRPMISRDKENVMSAGALIDSYARSQTMVNTILMNSYTTKMNITAINVYLDFIEELSDEFVQINKDTLIRKDIVNVSPDTIKEIDFLINIITNRYGLIDTTTFNAYSMLPKIQYKWNKHLLAGVVRTYLGDKYSVERTNNFYELTDFIIRRKK